jgi:hypothetical protein
MFVEPTVALDVEEATKPGEPPGPVIVLVTGPCSTERLPPQPTIASVNKAARPHVSLAHS